MNLKWLFQINILWICSVSISLVPFLLQDYSSLAGICWRWISHVWKTVIAKHPLACPELKHQIECDNTGEDCPSESVRKATCCQLQNKETTFLWGDCWLPQRQCGFCLFCFWRWTESLLQLLAEVWKKKQLIHFLLSLSAVCILTSSLREMSYIYTPFSGEYGTYFKQFFTKIS